MLDVWLGESWSCGIWVWYSDTNRNSSYRLVSICHAMGPGLGDFIVAEPSPEHVCPSWAGEMLKPKDLLHPPARHYPRLFLRAVAPPSGVC